MSVQPAGALRFRPVYVYQVTRDMALLRMIAEYGQERAYFFCNRLTDIICDTPTEKYIKMGYIPNLKLIWYIELNEFKGNRAEMERTNTFLHFLTAKTVVMDYALNHENDTLFLDTDMIVVDTIHVDRTKQLGVSPGFINKETAAKVGYYNAGMIWTCDKTMPEKWRHYNTTSRYFEQAAIEDLCTDYSYFTFGDNHNLQTWRFIVGNEPCVQIMSYIKIKRIRFWIKSIRRRALPFLEPIP